jgi:hypothetical protein
MQNAPSLERRGRDRGLTSRLPELNRRRGACLSVQSRRVVGPSLRLRSGGFGGAQRRTGAPVRAEGAIAERLLGFNPHSCASAQQFTLRSAVENL